MSAPMSQVLAMARTYLNDDSAAFWPDPTLIPKVQEAHREMQVKLWLIGSPIVRGLFSDHLISAYTGPGVNIFGAGGPNDFLIPISMQEAPNPANTPYTPMTEIDFIPPSYPAGPTLTYWVWDALAGQIYFPWCTANRSITIQYRRSILIPNISTDLIGVISGERYLAPRAAAIAAGAVGNKVLSDILTAEAEENFDRVILINRGQQKPFERP
jgi:hypothetical protein